MDVFFGGKSSTLDLPHTQWQSQKGLVRDIRSKKCNVILLVTVTGWGVDPNSI